MSDLKARLEQEASLVRETLNAKERVIVRAERRVRRKRITAWVSGAVLTVGVIALLLVQIGTDDVPVSSSPSSPPAWLVDAARRMASENGEPMPTSARWVLSDAATIAPAVGLASGDPGVPRYLVVLTGEFTSGGSTLVATRPPHGTVLTAAFDPTTHQVTDWGISDGSVDVPGLQPFVIPGDQPWRGVVVHGRHDPVPRSTSANCPVLGANVTASSRSGAPGSEIRVSGPLYFLDEDGDLFVDPEDFVQAWWDLDPGDYPQVAASAIAASHGDRPKAGSGPALAGDYEVNGACSFDLRFQVPDVPPGTYPVSFLRVGGSDGSATVYGSLLFTVTQ